MPLTRDAAIENIRTAFREVKLEDGIGLLQGQAIDRYEDEDAQAAARVKDESINWEAIPVEELDRNHSSLSFFDAKGMRFHLPAYLIAHLKEELVYADPVFHITHLDGDQELAKYAKSRLVLFSGRQRAAIRDYLVVP